MGAYLSEPLTDKESLDEENERLSCAASSMQGWRIKQEDAHNVILDFDTNASLFAVYDGHGGAEVAKYCAQKLPQFIKYTKGYQEGDYVDALENAFLDIDETMTHPYVVQTLKTLSDEGSEAVTDDGSEEEENVHNLYEESRMPLDELIAKYRSEVNSYMSHFKKTESTSSSSSSSSKPMSPFLRSKRSNAINDGAGSSSSSKCNESEFVESQVSSSTSSSSGSCSKSSNSESEVSTTNGDHSLPESPSISSTNDAECSKATSNNHEKSAAMESNTSSANDIKTSESDGSKDASISNNVSSEVCELDVSKKSSESGDGDVNSIESIESKPEQSNSNDSNKRSTGFYNNFIGMITSDDDDYESDSNDENFEGKEEGSSSEDDNATNGVGGDSSEEEESSEDEEDDDIDNFAMKIKNEPGSNSGCTAVVALLNGNKLYVANAGDSRCVVCRDGEAVDMSIDHKPEDDIELDRIIKAGGKVSRDGRVNGGLNLSRAIGDLGYKQNKALGVKEQMITAFPDVKTLTINPDTDKFMVLACDGIWNFMSSKNVVNFVSERLAEGRQKLSQICEEMFDHCLAPNTTGDGTGCDNMTAVIVVFKPTLKDLTIEVAAKKRPCEEVNDDGPTNDDEVQVKRPKTDSEESGSVSSSV